MAYDPRAYVPGGASPRVARAIQALGRRPARPRPRPRPRTRPVAPPPGVLDPMSYPAISAEADARAQAALAALQAPVASARDRAARQSKANQDALSGLGLAAAGLLKGIAPGIQSGYDLAARETGALAGGFSGAMADRVRAAQQENADFVASQVQGADAPQGTDPTALQDTSYALGGYIPAASLEAQGAAANRWGQVLPGIQALDTTQAVQGEQVRGAQETAQYEQQLIDLATKRPELRSQVFDQLYRLELDKLSARLSQRQLASEEKDRERRFGLDKRQVAVQERAQGLYERQFGETVRENQANEAIDVAGLQIDSAKAAQSVAQAEAKGRQIDAAASKVRGFVVDKQGRFVLDEKGKKIKVANTTTSAGDRNKLYRDAVEGARDLRPTPIENPNITALTPGKYLAKQGAKGVFRRPGMPATTNDPKKARAEGGMTFAEAQSYLQERYGLTRARARQALIAAGWKPDGKRP